MRKDDALMLFIAVLVAGLICCISYSIIDKESTITRGQVQENSTAYINISSEGVFFHKEPQCPNIYNEYFVDTIKNYPSGHPCYLCFPVSIQYYDKSDLRDDRMFIDCSNWGYVVNKLNERIYYEGRY